MLWRCPSCEQALELQQKTLRCPQNHCFDMARQGYVNLLLAQHKKSREPGDNEAMIVARRAFLRAGHYLPLLEHIGNTVEQLAFEQKALTMLDLGCGEGYYLETIAKAMLMSPGLEKLLCKGVDISKPAIRHAASAAKLLRLNPEYAAVEFNYAVASTFRLPLDNDCINLAINVFAPMDSAELRRVLNSNGYLIRVMPGAKHLFQLKELLYDEVEPHQLESVLDGFTLQQRHGCSFELNLASSESIDALLAMTPLNWHGDQHAKSELRARGELKLSADFDIQVLKPTA